MEILLAQKWNLKSQNHKSLRYYLKHFLRSLLQPPRSLLYSRRLLISFIFASTGLYICK